MAGADVGDARLLADVETVGRSDDGVQLIFCLAAAIAFRNRVMMRAEARMAEQRANRISHAARQQMLEFAGIGFAFFKRHADDINHQSLSQPMTADDLFSRSAALRCQLDFSMPMASDITFALAFSQQF